MVRVVDNRVEQDIRNTAHRPSTQASYTASRVRLNKENQLAARLIISFPC